MSGLQERIENLKRCFLDNRTSASSRRQDRTLADSLLLNVEFISSVSENDELNINEKMLPSLTELRVAAFVNELFKHTLVKNSALIYTDLALVDHSGESEVISFIWVVGHRLGQGITLKELLKRYGNYVERCGTSLKSENYILGGDIVKTLVKASQASKVDVNNYWVFPPESSSLRTPNEKLTGDYTEYVKTVILESNRSRSQEKPFIVYHLEAGSTNNFLATSNTGDTRDTCTVHLFLTFKLDDSEEVRDETNDILSEDTLAIQSQMSRIAGLYLIEKANELHNRVKEARRVEQETNQRLRAQIGELLQELKKVDSAARGLRQSLESPLVRYREWTQELLPQLFERTTGSLRGLNPYFDEIAAEHHESKWTESHVIAALWKLCEPPVHQSAININSAPSSNTWESIIQEAARRDSSDPWFFCANCYASIKSEDVPRLATMFKSIKGGQSGDNGVPGKFTVNGLLLGFLLGESLGDSCADKRFSLPKCWDNSILVGLPRLAATLKQSQAAKFDWSIEPAHKKVEWSVTIKWEHGFGDPSTLVRRVDALIRLVQEKLKPDKVKTTSSAILEVSEGKGDTSSAIVRVMLPELEHEGIEVRNIDGYRVTLTRDRKLLSSFTSDDRNFEIFLQLGICK